MGRLRVKRLDPRARLPGYASDGAAGMDLAALEAIEIPAHGWAKASTGLAVEIPAGCEGQVRPRSGLAARHGVTVLNAPGTIDSDYRGEVGVILVNHSDVPLRVEAGDRIAQLVVCRVERAEVEEVESLASTDRGPGGFGSTGR